MMMPLQSKRFNTNGRGLFVLQVFFFCVKVEDQHVVIFNYVAGMVPVIQQYIASVSAVCLTHVCQLLFGLYCCLVSSFSWSAKQLFSCLEKWTDRQTDGRTDRQTNRQTSIVQVKV